LSAVLAATAVSVVTGQASERGPQAGVEALVQQRCGYERLAEAETACVGMLADGLMMAMDQRIATVTTGLQAASASELSDFETGLMQSQTRWRTGMEAKCQNRGAARGAMPAARQICRLAEGLARNRRLDSALAGEFATMAGMSGDRPRLEGKVNLRIPLTGGIPGGPAGELELEIPLTRY